MPKVKCEICKRDISVSKHDFKRGIYPTVCPKCRKKAAKKGIKTEITEIQTKNDFSEDQVEVKKARKKW